MKEPPTKLIVVWGRTYIPPPIYENVRMQLYPTILENNGIEVKTEVIWYLLSNFSANSLV
jgi:hypothetical protein